MSLIKILTDIKSLFVGLGVTGKAFLAKNVTVVYPREEVDNIASFRGHIELVAKADDPTAPKCIACGLCSKTCPSRCFTILCPVPPKEGEESTEAQTAPAPVKGVKKLAVFEMDFSLCSLCGQCIKSCASKAIQFSNTPYLVGYSRKDFQIDLLARLKRIGEESLAEQAKAPEPEPIAVAPAVNAAPAAPVAPTQPAEAATPAQAGAAD